MNTGSARTWVRQLCIVSVLGTAVAARADILFDNFAPGNTYLGNAGWTLMNGGPLQAHVEDAAVFTVAGGDYFLTSLELAVGHLFGPNVLHVYIHADDGGLPGAILEQTTLIDQMPTMSTKPNICPPPVHVPLSGRCRSAPGRPTGSTFRPTPRPTPGGPGTRTRRATWACGPIAGTAARGRRIPGIPAARSASSAWPSLRRAPAYSPSRGS